MSLISVRVKNLRTMGYKSLQHWLEDSDDHVYIGRATPHVEGTYNSPWRNPFAVSMYGRDECIRLYKTYIQKKISNGDLDIETLRGKTLGCWCAPDPCHGDVLLAYLNK